MGGTTVRAESPSIFSPRKIGKRKQKVIGNDDMSPFPGHSVTFRGNLCLDV